MKLIDISYYVTDRISSSDISLDEYVTTDSLLPNKGGRAIAESLPPNPCNLIKYQENDILIANIRPYLKKIWKADSSGGASADVLVFRARNGVSPNFLFAALLDDAFYTHVMKATTGAKMPRGEKNHIMRYSFSDMSNENQTKIGCLIYALDRKIALNRKINAELEQMAKELYDYWFVQFDFPNAEGKPYKSSGGKMVYNPQLKRDIPEGWEVKNLPFIAKFENGIACQKYRPRKGEKHFRVIKIDEMHNGFSDNTEFVGDSAPNYARIVDGDLLFSWSASLEVMIWDKGEGVLNQHIFKVTPLKNYPLHYVYYQLSEYVNHFRKMAESRKTTMGHITQDHLNQSTICVPLEMDACNSYEKYVTPVFNKIISVAKETQRLTTLRNQLLPLLMNGQVKIK